MKSFFKSLLALPILLSGQLFSGIHIRIAIPNDCKGAKQLTHDVNMEFFAPLFVTHYPELFPSKENFEQRTKDEMLPETNSGFEPIIAGQQGLVENSTVILPNDILIVAVDDTLGEDDPTSGVVGMLQCHRQEDAKLFISLLAVRKSHRGKGLGTHLINFALQDLHQGLAASTALVLRKGNERARKFYETNLFVCQGPAPEAYGKDGYGNPWAATCDLFVRTNLPAPACKVECVPQEPSAPEAPERVGPPEGGEGSGD